MRTRKNDDFNHQSYEHRIECAIQALVAASEVVQKTSMFLREQMGSEWREQDRLLKEALKDHKIVRMWLKKAIAK